MLNQQERIHLIINLLSITEQKTKTLKIKLTILKFSSFSTTPTIRLKLTINLTGEISEQQNNHLTKISQTIDCDLTSQ